MPGFKDLIKEHKQRQDADAPPKRARGKSADPNYSKVTIYLTNTTLTDAKIKALKTGKDLSEVAEELFTQWLRA
jgi:hypothetical protein